MAKASFLVLGFCAGLSVAAAQSSYHSPQFFLYAWRAFDDFPSYVPVSDGKWATISKSDWQTIATDDPNVEQPSIVKLQFKVIGDDAVSITATALFGEFDRHEPSMKNMRSETVAAHSFKVNDLVSFPELKRFGISLNLNYRLVPAKPDRPYRPRLESRAPSLTFDFSQVDRLMGKITVHNHSDKAVVAFDMGNAVGTQVPMPEPGRTLIGPGATYEFDSDAPLTGWCIKHVCGTEPIPLILEEAVFEDGSHEGNETQAMQQAANWLGRSAEWKQIVSAASPTMSNPDLNELEKIHSLASIIDALSIMPDGDTVARFRMQFSDLPKNEMERGEQLLAMGMRMERDYVRWCLQSQKEDLDHKILHPSITEWWEQHAGR